MKTFIMISWRNMWRQKRRSMVVISSIGIGIFVMILSMGIMNGMNLQMLDNTINTSIGQIAIHQKGYQDTTKIKYNFVPTQKIYDAIKTTPGAINWAPHVKVQGMIRSAEASRRVLVFGIDPEKEKKISKIYDYTLKEDGSEFLKSTDSNTVLISKVVAKKLNLEVGDRLPVMVMGVDNEMKDSGLTITGLFETPMGSFDKYTIFVGIKKLQEMTGLKNAISEITIGVKDKWQATAIRNKIAQKINDKNLEYLSWQMMAPALVSASKLIDASMAIFFGIVFITVIFSIANTLVMAIMERFHEIGVMKSIGTKPRQVFFMILFEAINLGAVGLFIGSIAGGLLVLIFGQVGISFAAFSDGMRTFGTGSVIYTIIRAQDIVMAIVIVLITTVIAALYPATKAARIKPLEALNHI